MNDQPRYRSFSSYLKSRYSGPVRRISLDAGFSCPNRDGSLSREGCIFCLPPAFSPGSVSRLPLEQQLRQGLEQGRNRGVCQFIAYFQAYTNTYASPEVLRRTYETIRPFPEIKILAIGTRPDCVNDDCLSVIGAYARDYEVWLEFGLQSVKDATLDALNRGHHAAAFFEAVERTRRYPEIKICCHVILGLPGETREDEAVTASALARLGIEGVKIHPLHVVRHTRLEAMFQERQYAPLTCGEYADRVVLFLERLAPETVIQRLSADCPADLLVAPLWLHEKNQVLRTIETRLVERDTWQGKGWAGTGSGPAA